MIILKKIILMAFLLIPIAFALEECQRVNPSSNIPCIIHSTWKPLDCVQEIEIYNETGSLLKLENWSDGIPFCTYTFNQTRHQTYIYNSSIDSGAITLRDDNMTPLGTLILLPFLFGVALLIGGISLGKEHTVIKIGMFLLVPITFFASLHFGTLTIVEYYDFPALENLLGTTTYWVGTIFFFILSYFLIYMFYMVTHVAAQKKKQELEY